MWRWLIRELKIILPNTKDKLGDGGAPLNEKETNPARTSFVKPVEM